MRRAIVISLTLVIFFDLLIIGFGGVGADFYYEYDRTVERDYVFNLTDTNTVTINRTDLVDSIDTTDLGDVYNVSYDSIDFDITPDDVMYKPSGDVNHNEILSIIGGGSDSYSIPNSDSPYNYFPDNLDIYFKVSSLGDDYEYSLNDTIDFSENESDSVNVDIVNDGVRVNDTNVSAWYLSDWFGESDFGVGSFDNIIADYSYNTDLSFQFADSDSAWVSESDAVGTNFNRTRFNVSFQSEGGFSKIENLNYEWDSYNTDMDAYSFSFDSNGTKLVVVFEEISGSGGDGEIKCYNVSIDDNGDYQFTTNWSITGANMNALGQVDVHPNRELFAVGRSNSNNHEYAFEVRSMIDGSVVHEVGGAYNSESVDFSPDGSRLIVTDTQNEKSKLYDTSDSDVSNWVKLSNLNVNRPLGAKFSPCGDYIAYYEADNTQFRIVDVADGSYVYDTSQNTNHVTSNGLFWNRERFSWSHKLYDGKPKLLFPIGASADNYDFAILEWDDADSRFEVNRYDYEVWDGREGDSYYDVLEGINYMPNDDYVYAIVSDYSRGEVDSLVYYDSNGAYDYELVDRKTWVDYSFSFNNDNRIRDVEFSPNGEMFATDVWESIATRVGEIYDVSKYGMRYRNLTYLNFSVVFDDSLNMYDSDLNFEHEYNISLGDSYSYSYTTFGDTIYFDNTSADVGLDFYANTSFDNVRNHASNSFPMWMNLRDSGGVILQNWTVDILYNDTIEYSYPNDWENLTDYYFMLDETGLVGGDTYSDFRASITVTYHFTVYVRTEASGMYNLITDVGFWGILIPSVLAICVGAITGNPMVASFVFIFILGILFMFGWVNAVVLYITILTFAIFYYYRLKKPNIEKV